MIVDIKDILHKNKDIDEEYSKCFCNDLNHNIYVNKINIAVGVNTSMAIKKTGENSEKAISEELKDSIFAIRHDILDYYGYLIPKIRIFSDDRIDEDACSIKINNMIVCNFTLRPDKIFVVFKSDKNIDYGEKVEYKEVDFYGFWISIEDKSIALKDGGRIFTVADLMSAYIRKFIEDNLGEIITRTDIEILKEQIEVYNPAVISELENKKISNGFILKVIKELLVEKITIKNLDYILELICDYFDFHNDDNIKVESVIDFVRLKIFNLIVEDLYQDGLINTIEIDNKYNDSVLNWCNKTADKKDRSVCLDLFSKVSKCICCNNLNNKRFVFVCSKSIRKNMFNMLASMGLRVKLIAHEEIPYIINTHNIKTI